MRRSARRDVPRAARATRIARQVYLRSVYWSAVKLCWHGSTRSVQLLVPEREWHRQKLFMTE